MLFLWLHSLFTTQTPERITFYKGKGGDIVVFKDRLSSLTQVLCYTICDGYCVRASVRIERDYIETEHFNCEVLYAKLKKLGEL